MSTARPFLTLSPALLLALAPAACQQIRLRDRDQAAAEAAQAPEEGAEAPQEKNQEKKKGGVKPYEEVVKEDYEHLEGLFRVHRGEDKVLYEIPASLLGRDMLWVTQIERTETGFGYGGTPVRNRVVRWELRDEQVLLRDVKYRIRARGDDSLDLAVEASSMAPIIHAFPVAAWGPEKAPVIEVQDFFLDDPPEFSPKRRLGASGVDRKRSFMDKIKVFPENIETKVLATYRLSESNRGGGSPFPRMGRSSRDPSQSGVTVLVHHSMVLLPGEPMKPRIHDERVGFFSVGFEDYTTERQEVKEVRYVTRWRLEKKDPDAAVSEPVQPIVFYVGRGVPEKWRPYVHQGIEMWREAFAAAGFRNAIVAKDAPSREEDPDWDAEDARYSSIRWLPSTVENAMGPHVHDPRSGEILEADILVYHNVIKLIRDWYFVQASPNDPAAQKLPIPDETIGRALAYVVAHEVGHSLGFPHNMKASSAYTVAQLRDPEFTRKYGTEASIMDYGRFNYVAQPGDGAELIPKIGPYDFFAVEWGYRQFPGDLTPEEERQALEPIVARQVDDPMLRFGEPNPGEDPSQQTEDLGSDPIEATRLGLKNITRVASYLVDATCRPQENYDLLRNMYGELVGQRNRELMHVANVVGGFVRTNLWYGDAERMYEPVPAERQATAVAFLLEHGFQVPPELVAPEILERLETHGAASRILSAQRSLLQVLLRQDRIDRMAEFAARRPQDAYPPARLFQDLAKGIFAELEGSPVAVDLYRRNLQRAFVEVLADRLDPTTPASDLPALARSTLVRLLDRVEKVLEQGRADAVTQAHLEDLADRIRTALDPVARAAAF